MCDRPAPVSALCPRVEISLVLALACLNKNNKKNNNQKMNTLAYMSWRLTTLAKLSVDVSDVFSHELSRKGLQ